MGKRGNRVDKHESVTCLMNVFADWNYIDEGRALMNAYFDMHVHSTFSIDGVSTMEDYCLVAEKSGIRAICFTEHVDFNSEEKSLHLLSYPVFIHTPALV